MQLRSPADTDRGQAALNLLLRRLLTANTVSAVAQASVDTVSDVLGADLSWCGIVTGEFLTMAAYNGIHTGDMMAIWRLKVGEGIGGRVAHEGRTMMVRDYRHDRRRVAVMKSVIDEEGVRSALCAPLVSGADVLGVVYAAQREARDWTPDETQLLTDIGRDCGVALGQIRDRHREQERADQAHHMAADAHRVMKALLSTASSVGSSNDLGAGVNVLAQHLGMRVELVDRGDVVLRAAPVTAGEDDPVRWESLVSDDGLATLRARGPAELSPTDRELATIGALIIGLQLARERAALRAEVRLHGEVLHDLLEGRLEDLRGIRDRAMLLGIDLEVPRCVTCVSWHHGSAGSGQAVSTRALKAAEATIHARFPQSISIPHQDKLVVLVCPGVAVISEVHAELQRAVRHSQPHDLCLSAGLGRMCMGPTDYADSYAEATLALDVARRRPQPCEVLLPADLGFYGLFARGTGRGSLDTIVENALGPLLEADSGSGSEYVKTLNAYLRCDRHLERTGASLHVHPNTVRYRLAKVQEILGIDLRDVENRFLLELAIRVHAAAGEG